jgi:hypothetical protein
MAAVYAPGGGLQGGKTIANPTGRHGSEKNLIAARSAFAGTVSW